VKFVRRQCVFAQILRRGIYGSLGTAGICLAVAGCSRGPTQIEVPTFDPQRSASRAMEIYDKDGNGFVEGAELEKAPGLNAALKNLDTNKDNKVSAEEIAARIAVWGKMGIGLMKFSCDVTLDGSPVDGAMVTLVPEEFLGGVVQEASGETRFGSTTPVIPKEKRAAPDIPPGVQAGLYKVVISKKQGDQELIPARYNTETIIGQEVARDDPGIANRQVRYSLTTK
jgi:hypothetical protein